jgi:hypothetical protein
MAWLGKSWLRLRDFFSDERARTPEADTRFLLVDPAGFRAAVLFFFVGRYVVALFVEGHGAVVLAHIDFKLSCRAAPLPAIVAVAQAVETL